MLAILRQSIRAGVRMSSKRLAVAPTLLRFNSTAPDAKITNIVDQISQLNLLETSALISELKTRLNIADIAFPAAGAAPAQQAAAPVEEEVKEEVEEKTIFAVKLESFDTKSKAKVIKEVKSLLGLSLVEAKKFVESAPKVLKDNVPKEDAEKIKGVLEGLGAKVTLE